MSKLSLQSPLAQKLIRKGKLKADDFYASAKPNKYKAVRTPEFDSKREGGRYEELKRMQGNGEISGLLRQVRFQIIPKQDGERAAHYTADFMYLRNGDQVIEDSKPKFLRKKADYVLRRKLMLQVHGIKIVEI